MKHDYSVATTVHSRRPRRPIQIVMTPMIDVIFLLLVFFLATSSFRVIEQLLPSSVSEVKETRGNIPSEDQEITDDMINQVIIKLELDGETTMALMNGVVLSRFSELRDRLLAISETGSDVPVVIDPAAEVRARDVVRAYDWARIAGLSRIYLATHP